MEKPNVSVRRSRPDDLARVLEIQAIVAEAAEWSAQTYRLTLEARNDFSCLIAEINAVVAGFLLWRPLVDAEIEILNLAVAPSQRRRGAAAALIEALPAEPACFLKVRASNVRALALYRWAGFVEAGRRPAYYSAPVEDAIVMRRPSAGSL